MILLSFVAFQHQCIQKKSLFKQIRNSTMSNDGRSHFYLASRLNSVSPNFHRKKKNIDQMVSPVSDGNDRVQGLDVNSAVGDVCILNAYMP